jgi:hypothetical protein
MPDSRYPWPNERGQVTKTLWFDGSGWRVLAKRLETGSFQVPSLEVDSVRRRPSNHLSADGKKLSVDTAAGAMTPKLILTLVVFGKILILLDWHNLCCDCGDSVPGRTR